MTEPQSTPASDDAPDVEQEQQATTESNGREAAKYRRQLRDAEAERDTLRTTVETLQRGEITRLIAEQGVAKPEAVFTTGATLADMLDDDGRVDPAKVKAATDTAISDLGLAVTSTTSSGGGVRTNAAAPGPTWSAFLRGGDGDRR